MIINLGIPLHHFVRTATSFYTDFFWQLMPRERRYPHQNIPSPYLVGFVWTGNLFCTFRGIETSFFVLKNICTKFYGFLQLGYFCITMVFPNHLKDKLLLVVDSSPQIACMTLVLLLCLFVLHHDPAGMYLLKENNRNTRT